MHHEYFCIKTCSTVYSMFLHSLSNILADDPKNDTYSENDGWEFVSLGDQVCFMNISFARAKLNILLV